jgi:osmoprotectant transport system permease protein
MSLDQLEGPLAHLPDYLASHVLLSVGALAAGVALSLPLAMLSLRFALIRGPLLGTASVIQTIPGLALLALMVPLLGRIGVLPALVALVLYSMLPVLRNTVTGALDVDPNVLEAARGIGMTEGQTLLRVQMPLAAPMIVAGIRTAAVWTVGMATLSTPVGATSLGNFIFSGLQTQNTASVLLGCAGAAVLAIGLDSLIRLAEVAVLRRDMRLIWVSVLCLAATVGAASWPKLSAHWRDDGRPQVVLGAKTFTEQYILVQVMAERLRAHGFDVDVLDSLGSTIVFDALATGKIDVYVDYSGTIWANQMKRKDTPGSGEVLDEMTRWLADERGVTVLGPLGFENAYALAMRRDRAEAMKIASLSDLAEHAQGLSIGGDYEFFARPEWIAVRERYGLAFDEERSFDSSLMYRAVADGHVDAISAFSTDGRIAAFDLLVLDDPLQAFPPYDAVALLSAGAGKRPRLVAALQSLVGSIDDEHMRKANKLVDLDGRSLEEAARFLSQSIRD